VLNRKIRACERNCVDQLQHGPVDHWPHRLHVIYIAERPLHSL
jgi:hypothetical protein